MRADVFWWISLLIVGFNRVCLCKLNPLNCPCCSIPTLDIYVSATLKSWVRVREWYWALDMTITMTMTMTITMTMTMTMTMTITMTMTMTNVQHQDQYQDPANFSNHGKKSNLVMLGHFCNLEMFLSASRTKYLCFLISCIKKYLHFSNVATNTYKLCFVNSCYFHVLSCHALSL